ncbi:DUF7097 family protein [Natrarchaeobaculum aegyptiacum]|uniref:Uncharacterized protein n=1 Tax=Natrarchaeobaculum aegyptiacum TaxID=745377 RepID=A0A2Z2HWD1_9EURY|nr:hypothetical protein [Natrarchaeobaculum aegyptiacum]ARS91656.1 hypothetical protein B1756_03335 [Natrarchaeobaculum aegyptiacum]
MEKTPRGTSVGVDDPYAFVGICDHLTSEGRCRYAYDHYGHDPEFARERAMDDYQCPIVDPESDQDLASGPRAPPLESGPPEDVDAETPDDSMNSSETPHWGDCPHFRCRNRDRECVRCGLEEKRIAHDDERPLLEEHHLSYARDGETLSHEITVYLCRWCHAKVHNSWARITDDAVPDPEAIAELEGRRSREHDELGFESAAERFETGADRERRQ